MNKRIEQIKAAGFGFILKKAIGYDGVYTCGYRLKKDSEAAYTTIPYSKKYWYADPLIYEKDGKTYVFMEVFDKKLHIGKIGVCKLSEEGWGDIDIIIEEDCHLSFPMIFEYNDAIYMIPETSTANELRLYRCKSFPDNWTKIGSFFKGEKMVDSVYLGCNGNRVDILSSTFDPENDLRAKFFKYSILFNGEYITCEQDNDFNKKQKYTYYSRNAGYLCDNVIALQRSNPAIYGYSNIFVNIDQLMLDANKYGYIKERSIIKEMSPKDITFSDGFKNKPIGVHTYSTSDTFEVIDIQYLEFSFEKWKRRFTKRT